MSLAIYGGPISFLPSYFLQSDSSPTAAERTAILLFIVAFFFFVVVVGLICACVRVCGFKMNATIVTEPP